MTIKSQTNDLAQPEQEPVAFVPVHPRNGPLWSDTYAATSFSERSPNYPRMALYAAQPPAAPVEMEVVWSRSNLINLMTAVSKAHLDLTEQELFGRIADTMIQHLKAPAPSRSSAATDELPEFEDPRVQIVYEALCDADLNEPPNCEEHWEGWVSRNIVKRLMPHLPQGARK